MNTVVCVKQGPDTAAERTLRLADGTLDRESPGRLINELNESAIEDGLKIAEAHGSEVTIASMGVGKAVHLMYDALARSDALGTSLALSAVLEQTGFGPRAEKTTYVDLCFLGRHNKVFTPRELIGALARNPGTADGMQR